MVASVLELCKESGSMFCKTLGSTYNLVIALIIGHRTYNLAPLVWLTLVASPVQFYNFRKDL